MTLINFRPLTNFERPMAKRVGFLRRLLWRAFGRKRERTWF